jgi:hypothetical protein
MLLNGAQGSSRVVAPSRDASLTVLTNLTLLQWSFAFNRCVIVTVHAGPVDPARLELKGCCCTPLLCDADFVPFMVSCGDASTWCSIWTEALSRGNILVASWGLRSCLVMELWREAASTGTLLPGPSAPPPPFPAGRKCGYRCRMFAWRCLPLSLRLCKRVSGTTSS